MTFKKNILAKHNNQYYNFFGRQNVDDRYIKL